MKKIAAAILGAGLALVTGAAGAAGAWPDKPIKIVVGAPPGGANDTVARIVAEHMKLGQPVLVENRNGAASMISAGYVARAAPDGYTLLLASQTVIAVSPILNHVTTFDPQKDFRAVALFGSAPLILVTDKSFSAHSVKELIAMAKANPGVLNFGSGGVGTSPYMAGVLFNRMAGVDIASIPYPGEQAAITDILGGRVTFMFANASSALGQIRGGKMQGLAVTSAQRVPVAPDIPTMSEAGVPGFDAGTWLGVLAPAKTPDGVVDKINTEVRRVLALPEVKERLGSLGFVLSNDSPAEFQKFTQSEYVKWSTLIRDANIKAE